MVMHVLLHQHVKMCGLHHPCSGASESASCTGTNAAGARTVASACGVLQSVEGSTALNMASHTVQHDLIHNACAHRPGA